MFKIPAVCAALALAFTAAPAAAAIVTLNFHIEQSPGREYQHFGDLSGYPYDMVAATPIDGSVTVDSADLDTTTPFWFVPYDKFVALDFTVGSKTWGLDDLGGNSRVVFDSASGLVSDAILWFDSQNQLITSGVLRLYDGRYGIYCNGCVTRDVPGGGFAVPEPSAWALMILGFAGAGAMVRRRRAQGVTSAAL